ncbi:hypothetical protein ARMSODRAFT_1026896 [Armillaria solidipes]|uniref:Lipoxygenase domain-containing protein n=1 Tax=Armillaria solidipes TaxID=1076256 RepID=A0A2H3ATR3_9AGAR|nr:hypothetical protein ARMSODRAFT_1026896 [Armillaria solidipes]
MAPQQVVSKADGYHTVSWIWMMEGAFDKANKKEMERVYVEWLKSHAWVN